MPLLTKLIYPCFSWPQKDILHFFYICWVWSKLMNDLMFVCIKCIDVSFKKDRIDQFCQKWYESAFGNELFIYILQFEFCQMLTFASVWLQESSSLALDNWYAVFILVFTKLANHFYCKGLDAKELHSIWENILHLEKKTMKKVQSADSSGLFPWNIKTRQWAWDEIPRQLLFIAFILCKGVYGVHSLPSWTHWCFHS